MATWNTDNPKVGNQVSNDIPDIEENFQELHDVIEQITNGTLGTTEPSAFRVDELAPLVLGALGKRAKFIWKDADEIYMNAGAYYHNGTTDWIVYWDSQLTYQFTSLAASDWSYLYIDDSAVVSAGTNLLTASEFVDSTTEPSWSDAKHGWYNGEDKCIFAVRTDGSSDILDFYHESDFVSYGQDISTSNISPDDTWTDCTLVLPKFVNKAQVFFHANSNVSGNAIMYWRTNGSSSDGHYVFKTGSSGSEWGGVTSVITDSSQIVEIRWGDADGNAIGTQTQGWYFPIGM